MTEPQILEALGAAQEHGRLWEAVVQILENQIIDCTNESAPLAENHVTQYRVGRLSHALEIRDLFHSLMRTAKAGTPQGP